MNFFFPDKYYEIEKDNVFLMIETYLRDYQKVKTITIENKDGIIFKTDLFF